jgi:steroid 5-alpha reductase family enzyme
MLTLLLIGLAVALGYFAITWIISVKINNYGLLDAAWSYGVAILAPLYALVGPGYSPRKWLATAIGIAWSLRLGTYILVRVISHHPTEDVRYETLRKKWQGAGMFFVFFEIQAVIVVIFSLPFLFASFNTDEWFKSVEIVGLAIALHGLGGEALADRQMSAFKGKPANKGRVCRNGLWAYSRHPNYFFEAIVWFGFCLFAFGSPWGGIAISCPLLMLYFLLKVTGIPLTEEYAVKSKGDAYREYQQTTSAFIPWFRQK